MEVSVCLLHRICKDKFHSSITKVCNNKHRPISKLSYIPKSNIYSVFKGGCCASKQGRTNLKSCILTNNAETGIYSDFFLK